MIQFDAVLPDGLNEVASAIIDHIPKSGLVAFYGQMGAGKTTLIKTICVLLGVKQEVSSPTFALVNTYESNLKTPIYHFDFYRIKSVAEVYDMGYEDYFYTGAICLLEWPQRIEELLHTEERLEVYVSINLDHSRQIRLKLVSGH